jgi:hypothetical protein
LQQHFAFAAVLEQRDLADRIAHGSLTHHHIPQSVQRDVLFQYGDIVRIRLDRKHTGRSASHDHGVQPVMAACVKRQVSRRKHVIADECQLAINRIPVRFVPLFSSRISDQKREGLAFNGLGDAVGTKLNSSLPHQSASKQAFHGRDFSRERTQMRRRIHRLIFPRRATPRLARHRRRNVTARLKLEAIGSFLVG